MHRQWLLEKLDEYRGRHPSESVVVERFERFIEAHENCFHRECAPGHITGSAWVLDPAGERTLLTHHRKLDRWLQLGGHSDGEAHTMNVALREAEEESGLEVAVMDERIFDVDVHPIPARGDEPEHYHYDIRFLLQARNETFVVTEESKALKWVGAGEVVELTAEESVLRMVRKWTAVMDCM